MEKKEDNARKECKSFLLKDLESELGNEAALQKVDELWEDRYEKLFKDFYSDKVSPWRLYVAIRSEMQFL